MSTDAVGTRLITGDTRAAAEPFNWAARRAPVQPPASLQAVASLYGQPAAAPPAHDLGAAQIPAPTQAEVNDAYARGEAAGLASTTAERHAAADSDHAAFARAIESLATYRARLRHDAERDLVELALAIARRIVRRELTVDAEAITGLARAALDRIDAREVRRVRLHPAQAQAAAVYLNRLAPGIEIVPDAALDSGAAVFETSRGAFDAGLDTQIAEIERGLADLLE